jgi:hypothetical protein
MESYSPLATLTACIGFTRKNCILWASRGQSLPARSGWKGEYYVTSCHVRLRRQACATASQERTTTPPNPLTLLQPPDAHGPSRCSLLPNYTRQPSPRPHSRPSRPSQLPNSHHRCNKTRVSHHQSIFDMNWGSLFEKAMAAITKVYSCGGTEEDEAAYEEPIRISDPPDPNTNYGTWEPPRFIVC